MADLTDSVVADHMGGMSTARMEDDVLRPTLLAASNENPDSYAESVNIAMREKLPPAVVHSRKGEFKKNIDFSDQVLSDLRDSSAGLYDWLQEPDNARIAHDDVGFLQNFSKSVMDVPDALAQGQINVELGKLRFKQLSGTPLSEKDQSRLASLEAYEGKELGGDGFFANIPSTVAETIPFTLEAGVQASAGALAGGLLALGAGQAGPQVAAPEEIVTVPGFALVGGTFGAFKASYEIEAGLAYDEFINIRGENGERLDPDTAALAALFVGTANGALEVVSFSKLAKTIPGFDAVKDYFTKDGIKSLLKTQAGRQTLKRVAARYAETVATEGATEALQESITMYAGELQKLSQNGDFTMLTGEEQIGRIAESGKAGLQAGIGFGSFGTGIETGRIIAQNARKADPQAVADWVGRVKQSASESKLLARSPEKFKEMVEKQTGGASMYVNAEAGVEFFQSLPPEVQAQLNEEMPELYNELKEAAVSGRDIQVKQSEYFTYIAPKDEAGTLNQFSKMDPDQFTVGEIREANIAIREAMEAMRDDFEASQQQTERRLNDAEQIEQRIVSDLQNSGKRYAQTAIRAMASVHRSLYETQTERYGSAAQRALEKLYGRLRVEGPAQTAAPAPLRTIEDGYIDSIRNESKKRRKALEKEQARENDPKNKDLLGKKPKRSREKATPTPMINMLKARGGIRRGSEIAKELARMDITPKTHPALFKKDGGLTDIDNLPLDEVESDLGVSGVFSADADLNGYVDRDELLEALSRESFGDYIRTPEQALAEQQDVYMDQILEELDRQGIDPEDATNQQIRDALKFAADGTEYSQDGILKTDTEAFKNWFGDSKVVDENGKPLVVYHGTAANVGDDFAFDPKKIGQNATAEGYGFYLTDNKDIADGYERDGGSVIEAYLSMQKPLPVDQASFSKKEISKIIKKIIELEIKQYSDEISDYKDSFISNFVDTYSLSESAAINEVATELYENNDTAVDQLSELANVLGDKTTVPQAVKDTLGFDGFINENFQDGEGVVYVAWFPEQIKSVHNRGTFDPNDARILYQDDGTKRGSIQFRDMGDVVIRLTEAADMSTFLHESGHLWLEYWKEFAAQEDAPAEARADWDTLRDWLGIGEDGQITTDMHEKFARATEAYFMEGKAPSKPLERAFRQFASWLMKIYRDIRNLNVDLKPDVREVFDRMFATSEEIDAMAQRQEFKPDPQILEILTKAEGERYVKLTSQNIEQARENLMREAIRQHTRKQTKWFKEERAKVRADQEELVKQDRLYKAWQYIKTGTDFDGNPIAEGQDHKLNRKDFEARFGKENAKAMPAGLFTKEGGVDIRMLVDYFGFDNEAQMVEALMNMQPMKQRIDESTDAIMIERHGDMLNDGTLEREALDAVNDDLRALSIAFEMEQLSLKSGQTVLTKEQLQEFAQELLGDRAMNKIRAFDYYRSEVKHARETGKFLAQKNFEKAAEAKRKQLLNHYLYREARKAEEEQTKALKRWKKFADSDKKWAARKSMDIDYVYAIRSILDKYNLPSGGRGVVDFADWFTQFEQENPDAARTMQQLIDVNTAQAKDYRELTYNEFMGLAAAIDGLAELGRDAKDIEIEGQKYTTKEAVNKAVETILANIQERDRTKFYKDIGDGAKEWMAGFDKEITRMEFLLKEMDGGEVNGPLAQIFMNPLAQAQGESYRMNHEYADKLKAILQKNDGVGKRWEGKVNDTRLGGKFKVKNIVTIALNMGNESNLEKLLDGYEWEYADVKFLVERYLTKEDMDTVQEIWELFEDMRPDLQRVYKQVTGFPMEIIKPKAFTFKGTEYKGGYFPVVYDPARSVIGSRNEEVSVMESNFDIPSVGKGMGKSRTSYVAPLYLEFDDILGMHLGKTIHLVTHGKIIKDLNRIVMSRNFQKTIVDTVGTDTYDQFKPWLQAIARNSVYDSPVVAIDKFLRHMRVATTNLFMGFSVGTGIKQTLGMSTTLAAVTRGEISRKNYLKGVNKYITDPARASEFIMEQSAEMRARAEVMNADIGFVIKEAQKHKNIGSKIQSAGMIPIIYAQIYSVDMPTWLAGYQEGLERYSGNQKMAVDYADAILRQTQGSGAVKDLARVQRGSEAQKTISAMFGTYILGVLYPRMRELGIDVSQGHVARSIVTIMPLLIMPALLEGFMSDPPEDDEEWYQWALMKTFLGGMASIPIVGGIAEGVVGEYDYSVSPIASPINMFANRITSDDPEKFWEGVAIGLGIASKMPTYKPYKIVTETTQQLTGSEDINIPEAVGLRSDADR